MHKNVLVVIAICAVALGAAPAMAVVQSNAAPAAQGAPSAPAASSAQTADSNLDTVVCREELKTGTRTGHWRACLTVREWRDYDDYLSRMRNVDAAAWH